MGLHRRGPDVKLNELTLRLQAEHFSSPQACLTISAAIAEVEHGLAMLSRIGHVFHLEPGVPYSLPKWPQVLFHVESAPNGRVVNSWWEANDLGPGWWPTLAEAQQREGIRAQFAGRGGVGDRSLPMLVDGGPAGPRPARPIGPKNNRDLIDEWRRAIEPVRASGDGSWGNVTIHDGGLEGASGTGDQGLAATPAAGEELSGLDGVGDKRSRSNGSASGVHDAGGPGAAGVSEDALQGGEVPDREQSSRRAYDELGRVLAHSAETLAESRRARAGNGSDV